MGALLVPLAILAGASFDSFTKAPDAVANVIESVGDGESHTMTVTTTVAIPTRPEWSASEPAAAAAPDAAVTAPPAEQPAAGAPQRKINAASQAQPCAVVRDTESQVSKEQPGASMSVGVLPGRSGTNRDGHRESRPGRPVRCE